MESALEDRAADAIREANGPIFVGITGTTADYQSMLATARAFRTKHPACKIVLGGHHVSSQDEVVLRRNRGVIDYVIRGEGEIALLALTRANGALEAVPNLSYRVKGEIRRNPEARLLGEAGLDTISASYNGCGDFTAGKFDHITYVSARGCPLMCAFCVVRATAIRAKSIDSIIEDLRQLVSEGASSIAIEDNFFAHKPSRTLELCARIKELQREAPFDWDCQTRVESMRRPDIVQAMAEAGCTAAYLGVEALCDRHLRYLAKTSHPERYVTILVEQVAPLERIPFRLHRIRSS
jgi:anaerobic magnesium-protoporphyrin IX monomethyl ester cyclase